MSDQSTANTDPKSKAGAPGAVPFWQRMEWRRWLAGIIVLVGVAAAVRWASSGEQPDQPIAEQWNAAIKRLGFEPVYPPVEDLAVGDVFAMITDDAKAGAITGEPFAGRSIKLLHLDLTSEIEEHYRQTYQFPATANRPTQDGQAWPQVESTESLFKPPATRTALPLVLFPRFTVTRSRRASGSGALSGLWQGVFGAAGSSSEAIDVRISATETYGVAAIAGETRLLKFCEDKSTGNYCSDKGLRKQLSIVVGSKIDELFTDPKTGKQSPRFSVELALVNRVFLARSIQTSFNTDSGVGAQANLTKPGSSGTTDQQAAPAAAPVGAPPAAAPVAAPPAADGTDPKPATPGTPAAQTPEERRVAAMNANRNLPGASGMIQQDFRVRRAVAGHGSCATGGGRVQKRTMEAIGACDEESRFVPRLSDADCTLVPADRSARRDSGRLQLRR